MAKAQIDLMAVGGGMPNGVSLWKNPNDDGTTAYSNGEANLNSAMTNYDYLLFICQYSTTQGSARNSILISVDEFKSNGGNTTGSVNLAFSCYYASGSVRNRAIVYKNDTTVTFGTAFNAGATGSDSNSLIPIEIRGIKF